ncbi:MAG: hypothetical protein ABJN40_22920 [Sneathiella sp.]
MSTGLEETITKFVDQIHDQVVEEVTKKTAERFLLSVEEFSKIEMKLFSDRVYNSDQRELHTRLLQVENLIVQSPVLNIAHFVRSKKASIADSLAVTSRRPTVLVKSVTLKKDAPAIPPLGKDIWEKIEVNQIAAATEEHVPEGKKVEIKFENKLELPFSLHFECEVNDTIYHQRYDFDYSFDSAEPEFSTLEELLLKRNQLRKMLNLLEIPTITPDAWYNADLGSFYYFIKDRKKAKSHG